MNSLVERMGWKMTWSCSSLVEQWGGVGGNLEGENISISYRSVKFTVFVDFYNVWHEALNLC